ncbi:hypothetical protein HNQ60_004461 [Povalibacter uvarum]|uniref:YdhG-like domain-containing protein n=1 Tax=Povalibacter uvarum TaxID=732238 RepID=A0A841HQE7_9GAMM|nr:DUF1801 domain-containing protein [Povalibacter uvarum]MBB6095571.1 hypothetical protein [Povalibacter uvarum]
MQKTPPAANPDAYVEGLCGWQQEFVIALRRAARSIPAEEVVKWGHLVYLSNGPAFLIRAEAHRVLFGFWRGQRLLDIEPRLKPGGKYEMATLELLEGMSVSAATARKLVKQAVELNETVGDPTRIAPRPKRAKKAAKKTPPRVSKKTIRKRR